MLIENDAGKWCSVPFVQIASRYARFGLQLPDSRLKKWTEWAALAGDDRVTRRSTIRDGIKHGADPRDWYATTEAAPLDELIFQSWYPGAGCEAGNSKAGQAKQRCKFA